MSTLYNTLTYTKNPNNVVQYSTPLNLRNHYPSIVNLGGQNLFCAFTHYGAAGVDVDPSEIWGCYSTNNGLSWGDTFKCIDIRAGKSGVVCPCLYRKANDDIIMITLERHDDATMYGQLYQYVSDDDGLTWDAGTKIYESSDYETNDYLWISSHRILVTSTGRLLLPFGVWTSATHTTAGNSVARVLYSDNEGTNWSLSATTISPVAPSILAAGTIAQLPSGTLVQSFRTRTGYGNISKSTDNGSTWSTPVSVETEFERSNADGFLAYVNGKLISIVSRIEGGVPTIGSATRIHLDLWQSLDGGDIWSFVKNLLYKDSVYVFTEPIVYDKGDGILMFYSHYPFDITGGAFQDLRFERLSYADLT